MTSPARLTVFAVLAALSLAACSSPDEPLSAGSPPAARTSSLTTAASTASATADDSQPDRIFCKVTSGSGGSYYLAVVSATDHNFTACDGAERLPLDTDVFALDPTMDGRCTNAPSVDTDDALINVYSTEAAPDLAAAAALCSSHGWPAPE